MCDTYPKCKLGQSLALILTEYEIKIWVIRIRLNKIKSFVTTSGKMSQICISQICREMMLLDFSLWFRYMVYSKQRRKDESAFK